MTKMAKIYNDNYIPFRQIFGMDLMPLWSNLTGFNEAEFLRALEQKHRVSGFALDNLIRRFYGEAPLSFLSRLSGAADKAKEKQKC